MEADKKLYTTPTVSAGGELVDVTRISGVGAGDPGGLRLKMVGGVGFFL